MNDRRIELKVVEQNGSIFQAGEKLFGGKVLIEEIYITNDGFGEYGCYDRIHVVFADGSNRIMPANKCDNWICN